MFRNMRSALAVCLALCLPWGVAAAQETAALLPNGARALTEDYGHWQVICAVVGSDEGDRRACVMAQRQTNGQGEQILAIELWPSEGAMSGLVVMPFGVAVGEPISLTIDNGAVPMHANVSTCMQTGCIVPLVAGTELLTAMKAGNRLMVSARSHDGQDYAFPVPLDGFTAAVSRLENLSDG